MSATAGENMLHTFMRYDVYEHYNVLQYICRRMMWAHLTVVSGHKCSVFDEKIQCVHAPEGEGVLYMFVNLHTINYVTLLAHNIFSGVIWANLTIISGHKYSA